MATAKATARASFVIGNEAVHAGQRRTVDLPVAQLYTHADLTMPVQVLHGKKDGPVLFVCAAVHGDEIQGVEIIRRLLARKRLSRIRGTLLAVPVVNVFGFIHHTRYLPDRRDLNRFFPGSTKGSLTSTLAATFVEEVMSKATHGLDLHTGSGGRTNLPHIRASLDDDEAKRLAMAFGAPLILNGGNREGSLRSTASARGIPTLVYEAGGAHHFEESSIRAGLRGILSVMAELGMLPQKTAPKSRVQPLVADGNLWVRAPMSGILREPARLGQKMAEGGVLGIVSDPFGETEEIITAPCAGMVFGRQELPLVHKGDALFHLATFEGRAAIVRQIDAFTQEIAKDDFL